MSAFDGVVDRTSALLGAAFDGLGGFGSAFSTPTGPSKYEAAGPTGPAKFDFLYALGGMNPKWGMSSMLPPPQAPTTTTASAAPSAGAAPLPPVGTAPNGMGAGPQAFIQQLRPSAEAVSQETGIPADVLLAIAANETGFGKAVAGNNYYGIKATGTEPSVNSPTWEVVNGQRVNINANFRSYDSVESSMRDFAQFLHENPRYAAALQQVNDPAAFVRGLQQAGYATDPEWSKKIISLMGQVHGMGAVKQAQDQGALPTQDPDKAALFNFAYGQQGKRYAGPVIGEPESYRWGSPGWDCSSFVSSAFKQIGVNLTPFTDTMFNQTSAIGPEGPQPGDLVFFSGYSDGQAATYKHVAIYVGNGQIIDAGYGTGVSRRPLNTVVPGATITFRRAVPQ